MIAALDAYITTAPMQERVTDGISDFRQTVGVDPSSNVLTFPSTWNNLLKQSSLKCSEQTMNRPLGLNFFAV